MSKGCNVAGDWPTGGTGGIAEPIWLQILMLSPEEEGWKEEIIRLVGSLLSVARR